MNQEQMNKIQKKIWAIEIGLVVCIAAYIGITLLLKIENILAFQIVIVTFLILFQLVDVVLQPYWMGQLKDLTPEKKMPYIKVVLLGVANIICLSIFVFSIGQSQDSGYSSVGFYFALGSVLINRLKHSEKKKFLGIEDEKEDEIKKNYEAEDSEQEVHAEEINVIDENKEA